MTVQISSGDSSSVSGLDKLHIDGRTQPSTGSGSSGGLKTITCGNSVDIIGNSIAWYWWGQTSDAGLGSTQRSFGDRFNMQYTQGGRVGLEFVNNFSVSGTTLQQTIASQLPLVQASNSPIVWDHSGTNNLGSASSNNDPLDVIYAQKLALVTALAAAKKFVIVDAILPVQQSGSTSVKPRSQEIPVVNQMYKEICNLFPNVFFNNGYFRQVAHNSGDLRLNPPANSNFTDGIHQSALGAFWAVHGATLVPGMVEDLLSQFNLVLTPLYDVSLATDYGPTMGAVSGTGSVSAPGSGTISGSGNIPPNVTATITAGTGTVTFSQKAPGITNMAFVPGAGGNMTVTLSITDTATLATHFTNKKLISAAKIGLYGLTNLLTVDVASQVNVGTTAGSLMHSFLTPTDGATPIAGINYPQWDRSECHRTRPLTVSGTPTDINSIITIQVQASGGANVDISEWHIYAL